MLSWEMRSYRDALGKPGAVFFDRGLPELVGYFRLMGLPLPAHFSAAAEHFRYNRRVFIAPPWPEIFTQDSERKQTPEEAERTHDAVADAYAELGYELVPLPKASVEARFSSSLPASASDVFSDDS